MIRRNLNLIIISLILISNLFPTMFIVNREANIFEIFQPILILITIFIHLKSRRYYLKFSNILIFFTKFLFYGFLFYEEISFFTYESTNYLTKFNSQSEINIHNLDFLGDTFLRVELPQINYSSSIETYVFVVAFALFILGYGSSLPFFNRFKLLFLEKKFSIYTFLFGIDYLLSSLISKVINPSMTFIHFELVELFIYFIILLDVIEKRKILKSNLHQQ